MRKGIVNNGAFAPPDSYYDNDPAKKNRMVTQAQLKGLIEYLLHLRQKPRASYETSVQYLVSQQGYPDLKPSDTDKPTGYAGDVLGELYDLNADASKNRLLQLMKSYPNGTRYAVFLYGKGTGVGDQHWLYAEKYNDKVVFRDFQKSLKVDDTEAWPPTAYLEEPPLTPVDNHAGIFSKGMFIAYVPIFSGESASAVQKTLAAAAERQKASPPQFHETVPSGWTAPEVALTRQVSDEMLGVINASIAALLGKLGITRTGLPKMEWEKNYFELDTPKMGLAMLYCANLDEKPADEKILKSIYTTAATAGEKLRENKSLNSELSGAKDNREKTTRVIRFLWKTPDLLEKILPKMKADPDLGAHWSVVPAAKRCGSIREDGKQAVYMHARNGQTPEAFFYTALHEFMHLTSGSPEGLMDWTPPALIKITGDKKSGPLFDLRNNLNEGFTDLFTDLAACHVRKYKASSMPGLVPPVDQGLRAYTYLRQAVMLLAEKLETPAASPPNPLLQGVKALAGVYFKADWAGFAKQIKTDATRPNPAFFGHVKDLSLYPTAYKSGPAAAALTALGLPTIEALGRTADKGVALCKDVWGFVAPPAECSDVLGGASGTAVESSVKGFLECLTHKSAGPFAGAPSARK